MLADVVSFSIFSLMLVNVFQFYTESVRKLEFNFVFVNFAQSVFVT